MKPETNDILGKESDFLTKEDENLIEKLTGLPYKVYPIVTTKMNKIQNASCSFGPPLQRTKVVDSNLQIVEEKPSRRIQFAESIKVKDNELTIDKFQ